jgi:hypothetical protein
MSMPRNDILYLPVIKLETTKVESAKANASGSFYVAVNSATYNALSQDPGVQGVLDGYNQNSNPPSRDSTNFILLHQGIDNEAKDGATTEFIEAGFLVEIDDRFGAIASRPDQGNAKFSTSYIDDDQKALYYITDSDTQFYSKLQDRNSSNTIAGPVGSSLSFTINSSDRLRESDYLMQRLGATVTLGSSTYYYVDTNVRVSGITYGYRIDIPVRFLKLIGS